MTNTTVIMIFIFAGLFWAGVLLICLSVFAGIKRLSAPKPETCTRTPPHICCINGACNGLPKVTKIEQSSWSRDWDNIESNGGGA
jgi:hypothetical protein